MVEEKSCDILNHRLVPSHRILNEEESKKVLEKYNIKSGQLPKIFTTDAVSKELGAKIGDIVEIIRDSPTAGTTIYYRIVTKKTR